MIAPGPKLLPKIDRDAFAWPELDANLIKCALDAFYAVAGIFAEHKFRILSVQVSPPGPPVPPNVKVITLIGTNKGRIVGDGKVFQTPIPLTAQQYESIPAEQRAAWFRGYCQHQIIGLAKAVGFDLVAEIDARNNPGKDIPETFPRIAEA